MINKEQLELYIKENTVNPDSREEKVRKLLERENPILDLVDKITGRNKNPLASGINPRKHPDYEKMVARLNTRKEDFVDRLIYYINLKEKTHPEVYNAAGMTPDCFSKIISKKTKKPTKENIVALGLALELNLDEINDLLFKAGYAFTGFGEDIIYQFCFECGPCTVDEVNKELVERNYSPIGGRK